MRQEFTSTIRSNQAAFGIDLSGDVIELLADYYELVKLHNPILHLVAPCSPAEFATRHILESLTLLKHLPAKARFADVGAGAGLPSVPCLIARDDLSAVLIESKEKKSRFLNDVSAKLFEPGRVEVIERQFGEVKELDFRSITCRALDKFVDKLPRLLKWAHGRQLLLFGGGRLGETLDKMRVRYETEKMPFSEQRYLFVSRSS